MSHERTYSADGLEFVKQVCLEQLHFAVLSALQKKAENYKASSSRVGKLPMSDFVRGWRLDRAQAAPKPKELRVGQSVHGSALMTTLKCMSHDRDFDGIADLASEVNNLQIARQDIRSSGVGVWSDSLDRLAHKAKQTIAGLRFSDIAKLFKPLSILEVDVDQVIDDARLNYQTLVLKKPYPFFESQAAAINAKSEAASQFASKSSSSSMLNCFRFSSTPKYLELGEDDVVSDSQDITDDSIAGKATKIFAQYFKDKGLKIAWLKGIDGNKIPKKLLFQHLTALRMLDLLKVTVDVEELVAPLVEIAEFMHEDMQRQNILGCRVVQPKFFLVLQSIAAIYGNTCRADMSFEDTLQRQVVELQTQFEQKQEFVTTTQVTYDRRADGTLVGGVQLTAEITNTLKGNISTAKAAVERQEGVNKCFGCILSAIEVEVSNAVSKDAHELLLARESGLGCEI
jgi:hypothetical protein